MKNIYTGKGLLILLTLIAVIVSPLGVQTAKAATTLTTGDIAFTGYNSDNPDQFAFVLLVDVDADTSITFTDSGWFAAGGFRATEGTGTITFNGTYQAGAQITIQIDPLTLTSSDGNNSGISWQSGSPAISLSTSGDQILAYQGTPPAIGNENNFLAAIQMNGDWDADSTSSNTSAKPSAFASCCAIAISPEVDNGYYSGSRNSSSDIGVVRTLVTDPSYWITNNSAVTIPNESFTTPTAITLSNLTGDSVTFTPLILLAIGFVILLSMILSLRRRKTF